MRVWNLLVYAILLIGLPLLGGWLTDGSVQKYLTFPPRTRPHQPEPFFWIVFLGLTAFVFVIVTPFILKVFKSSEEVPLLNKRSRFPIWGWAGLILLVAAWVTHDLGTPALKGVTEELRVHQVVQSSGVRGRLDLTREFTPLIGRDQELGLLLDRWQLAQEGRGRVILISGEAGLGKSRLLYALRERLADRPHTWLEASCSSYTSGSAFQPVLPSACAYRLALGC